MVKRLIKNYQSQVKENSYKGVFIKNLSYSFLLNIGSIVVTYITNNLILTHIATTNEIGTYVSINNMANIIAIFAPMGLNALVLRLLPEHKSKGEYEYINGFLKFGTLAVSISSVLLSLLFMWLFSHFNILNGLKNNTYMIIGMCCIPFISLLYYFQSVLSALKHTGKSLLSEKIIRPLLVTSGFLLIFFTKSTLKAGDMLLVFCISCAIIAIIAYRFMQRGQRIEIPQSALKYNEKSWLKQGWLFVPLAGVSILNSSIDIQMIGWLLNEKEAAHNIAIFNVAAKAAGAVSLGLLISNYVIGPAAAELYFSNQKKRLQNVINKSWLFTITISLPLLLILGVFGEQILGLSGEVYKEGYPVLLILLVGQFVNFFMGPMGYLLLVTKNEIYCLIGMGVSIIINIALNVLLAGDYGIKGIAFSTAIATATWNIIMWYFLVRKTGLNSMWKKV